MRPKHWKRWANLSYLSMTAIKELHQSELRRIKSDITMQGAGASMWEDVPMLERLCREAGLRPFYIGKMPDFEMNERADNFCSAIFPYWAKVYETHGMPLNDYMSYDLDKLKNMS